jgi:cytochrome c nitrite reductase small subunit
MRSLALLCDESPVGSEVRSARTAWLIFGVLLGVGLGLTAYTFVYAKGASYLGSDPRTCVNCHIMRLQFDSWQKSSHHAVATCVECHLPEHGLAKWVAKASNGYHHSKAFTLQDFAEPIRITPGNAAILQENCLRCHGDLAHELVADRGDRGEKPSCVHCHSEAGHGERAGLGGPEHDPAMPTGQAEGEPR